MELRKRTIFLAYIGLFFGLIYGIGTSNKKKVPVARPLTTFRSGSSRSGVACLVDIWPWKRVFSLSCDNSNVEHDDKPSKRHFF